MSEPSTNPYLRDAVMTATPEQLHLMLYDGAIRNAMQAREAILAKDYEASYNKLTRAQHIVLEMHNGLNFDVNAELCGRMASIYGFLYRKLVDACIQRNVQDIDDALKVLRIERETWQMLVDKVNRIRNSESDGSEEPASPPASTPAAKTERRATPKPPEPSTRAESDDLPAPAGFSLEG